MSDYLVTSRNYRKIKTMAQKARELGIDPTRRGWIARLKAARQEPKKAVMV